MSPAGISRFQGIRNGRKMQILLPLWHGMEAWMPQVARCRDPMMKPGAIWNDGISWSFLPKCFRGPHTGNLPHGDEGRQGIDRKHDCGHD